VDFPRKNGHKKCPDGVDEKHLEKSNGWKEISDLPKRVQVGSVGNAQA
jgi:hypothetical protein